MPTLAEFHFPQEALQRCYGGVISFYKPNFAFCHSIIPICRVFFLAQFCVLAVLFSSEKFRMQVLMLLHIGGKCRVLNQTTLETFIICSYFVSCVCVLQDKILDLCVQTDQDATRRFKNIKSDVWKSESFEVATTALDIYCTAFSKPNELCPVLIIRKLVCPLWWRNVQRSQPYRRAVLKENKNKTQTSLPRVLTGLAILLDTCRIK